MIMQMILKKGLLSPIALDKLGITFRPLSSQEQNDIIIKFDSLFFNQKSKRRIKDYIEYKEIEEDWVKLLPYLAKHKNRKKSYEEETADHIYSKLKHISKEFNKNYIKKQLKKIVIIEFCDKLDEFISKNTQKYMIKEILRTFLYATENFDYKKVKDLNICSDVWTVFNDEFLLNVYSILNYDSDGTLIINEIALDDEKIKVFNNFLNILTKERIRDFLLIVDNLFSNNVSIDNQVLNYISILERLFVKYDKSDNYDIGKQICLKFGLCMHDYKDGVDDFDVKNIKYCYEVRSCIIHGNDIQLLNAPKQILKLDDVDLFKAFESEKIYDRRFLILFLATRYLEYNMSNVLMAWFNNPKKIEFLKQH